MKYTSEAFEKEFILGNEDSVRAYLQRLSFEDKARFVKGIQYTLAKCPVADARTLNVRANFFIPKQKSLIIVYSSFREAFLKRRNLNEGDLMSLLIDHEGQHAQDLFYHPQSFGHFFGFITWMPLVLRTEIRAYANQQENFNRRGCSSTLRDLISHKKRLAENELIRLTGNIL